MLPTDTQTGLIHSTIPSGPGSLFFLLTFSPSSLVVAAAAVWLFADFGYFRLVFRSYGVSVWVWMCVWVFRASSFDMVLSAINKFP